MRIASRYTYTSLRLNRAAPAVSASEEAHCHSRGGIAIVGAGVD